MILGYDAITYPTDKTTHTILTYIYTQYIDTTLKHHTRYAHALKFGLLLTLVLLMGAMLVSSVCW